MPASHSAQHAADPDQCLRIATPPWDILDGTTQGRAAGGSAYCPGSRDSSEAGHRQGTGCVPLTLHTFQGEV